MNLHVNNTICGQELMSVYETPELIDRLKGYNSGRMLVASDIDDTMVLSPTKILVLRSIPKFWRWGSHPKWILDLAVIFERACREGWSKEQIEDFSLNYAKENVLEHFSEDFLRGIVQREAPSFFKGVPEVMGYFAKAEKVLVTRGFREVGKHYAGMLKIDSVYHFSEDKTRDILRHISGRGIEGILYFGDLSNDAEVVRNLRSEGYNTDFVQVSNKKNYFPEATIVIPRDWRVFEGLLK